MKIYQKILIIILGIATVHIENYAQKNANLKQAEPEIELVIDRTRKQELLPPKFDKTAQLFNLLKMQNKKYEKLKANDLETQQIANILWAANGYKYLDGCTPPESYIEIFLVMEDGVYKWQPEIKNLQDISMEDFRKLTWQNADAEGSTLSIVYVADVNKFTSMTGIKDYKNSLEIGINIGNIGANVKLAASYGNLFAFEPKAFSNDKLKAVFKLPKGKEIVAVQSIATIK